jgi:SHS2 domain-containing protein
MTATWESHEAEEQLEIVAGSPERVVVEAVEAFSRYVEQADGGEAAEHELVVSASGKAEMLVELLQELIYLAETEGFVADEAVATFAEDHLRVQVRGRRTTIDPLMKAATYHDLSFEQRGDSWHARVVLDV